MSTQEIISQNSERLAEFTQAYNPITGEGSLVPRFKFRDLYLPITMKDDPLISEIIGGAFAEYPEVVDAAISEQRFVHDFEYWVYTNIVIKDKKTGDHTKFKLNRAQRRYISRLEKLRVAGTPIRIILLKARQWGGSTATQIYALWLQNIHHQNWNSCIVADIEDQVRNISNMYRTAATFYPAENGSITLKNFEGSTKNKQIEESGSIIYVGSMQKPENLRSGDYKIAHLSEIGLWKATLSKKPEDVIQTIIGSVPPLPDTMIVQESTAKGVGNYFHKIYTSSKTGNTPYETVFVPWFEFSDNMMPVDNYELFIASFTDYELFLWHSGATLEGIKWYRWKLSEYDNDEWRMRSEFPTNEVEAFQATGSRVFPIDYVTRNRKSIIPPLFVGEWLADAVVGPASLNQIHWASDPQGNTKVWLMPETGIKDRYLTIVDIGGTGKDSDWSVIKVIDRYWRMYGGKDETALKCTLHQDVDIVIWKAARISKVYDNSLLVIEINSLNRKKDAGENYYASLAEIADVYPNLYKRQGKEDEEGEAEEIKYGFHTNKLTKPMIVSQFKAALRDELRIIRDTETLDEADTYEENKQTGEYAAVKGCHDDNLITEMIGHHISTYVMEVPREIVKTVTKKKNYKRDVDI